MSPLRYESHTKCILCSNTGVWIYGYCFDYSHYVVRKELVMAFCAYTLYECQRQAYSKTVAMQTSVSFYSRRFTLLCSDAHVDLELSLL